MENVHSEGYSDRNTLSIQYLFSKFKIEEAQRIRNIMIKSEYRNSETQYEKSLHFN